MKVLIPKQHGAWAMLAVPFILGVVGGGADGRHVPLFIGWLFLYLAAFPVTMMVKKKKTAYYQKWAWVYSIPAVSFLVIAVWMEPGLVLLGVSLFPLFLINLYYAKTNNDRALLNDIAAIGVFSAGGVASYWIGAGMLDGWAWFIFIQSILFFTGSAFYVKSMIREKKNKRFKWYSWGYHTVLPILSLGFGAGWAVVGLIPSSIRAWLFYGRKLSVKKIGIFELVNACVFLTVVSVFLLRI
ncbi:YwiC-like family protein [Bacillus sp. HSf4]|uniref:YwiC-like family protein n=1 Tax=Bacillus sp. HSf4 TaxID=3035514 RepID=UPI002409E0AF|nr:YwiC-like family protein [Bacillus sp. HSf4]WFA07176.1 YwiC-like family protein [Bacillus sp. HSf4]